VSHCTKPEASDPQRPDEGVHAVSVTPADERRSTEHGEASGASADERYVIGVDYGTLSGRALGRQAGTNSDTEHDGIEAVTA
jgi:hypothetical protein